MKTIAFPESNDPRIVAAAKKIRFAKTLLIKEKPFLEELLKKYPLPEGIDKNDAMTYACLLLKAGKVDGVISGADHPTAHTIKHAIFLIGTTTGYASSYFLMKKGKKKYLFADCGFNINPNAKELATIALQTAQTAKTFGIEPVIGMLSFSTNGSAKGPEVEKVQQATKLVQKKHKQVIGEIQFDAALIPAIGKKKTNNHPLAGKVTVFVFPTLDAGNIGYKIAERLGGFKAIGPLLQGFKKPVFDLSRGCSVEDVIEAAKIIIS
ncbi:MAG: phosphate acetyltransferase [Candidatus Woesearchaeota archaeon]|nr:MAG: phosphate acetyltransferase [Candidatus Woesearchaeota archaeon]